MTNWRGAASMLGAAAIAVACGSRARIAADELSAVVSPVEPQESLQHLIVERGLKVELAACEPQIIDPVAVRFDERGRMWVVEMRDYPVGPSPGQPPISRISVLEDRDGDGRFESATVFADNLLFATGVQPWRGGVFVTMAGEVAYMKDTDGDGRADLRETWFRGFAEKNSQLRANDPRLALDNHIYVANGLRGGKIVDARRPERPPLSISGMDFRFDPLTGDCEAMSGAGQFGLTFDDFGNRFVCTNRNPAIHVVLENRFLKQNPLVAVPAVVHDVAQPAADSRVFPLTRSWTTSNLHAGQFTAACGVEIYRGDALGADYYGNLLVCEPTAHLVQRQIMSPRGVTFEARPALDGKEFLASRDPWFSPVNLEVGPDGALYVVDMYRAVIEHPDWVPDELKHRPDQMLGNDRGRVYRVTASSAAPKVAPSRIANATSAELVAVLADANAWRRETAARLILERADRGIADQLQMSATTGKSPVERTRAVWLREGLGLDSDSLLRRMFDDADPLVVEQAIMASERRSAASAPLRDHITQLANHDDARVRFAALLVGNRLPDRFRLPVDQWERDAVLIAAGRRGGDALAAALQNASLSAMDPVDAKRLIADLARLAAAANDDQQSRTALAALVANQQFCRPGLTSFLAEALRDGTSVESLASLLSDDARGALNQEFAAARAAAADRKLPDAQRCEALDLAALAGQGADVLAKLAAADPAPAVRIAAIAALARQTALEPWRPLLASFATEPPAIRTAILASALAQPDRTLLVLDEIAAGRIKPAELGAAQVEQLLAHADEAIKTRAQELVASALPADRQQALADYQVVLTMKGDAARGRAVFEQRCSTCHRIGDVGINVAPDISDSREKTRAQILADVVQPNRAIDANYFSYTAVTEDGLAHTGVLAAETGTSITLKQPEGKTLTLRRREIEELRSNGVSLMPEGLERDIPPQAMADLIEFVKGWRYLDNLTPLSEGK